MRLRIAPAAEEDLRAAATWYERRQPGLGVDLIAEVDAAVQRIRLDPERFAQLETSTTDDMVVRRVLLARFPFAIIFESDDVEVRVLAVAHTSRRPGFWIDRP